MNNYTNLDSALTDVKNFITDRTSNGKKSFNYYKERHEKLYNFCPAMFQKIYEVGPDTPMGIVEQMLKYKFSVDNGEISQHDASVAVGQVCIDKYVKPLLSQE